MASELPSASVAENVRFNALVVVPNALKGLFKPRRRPWAVATKAGVDGRAIGFLRGMSRKYAPGPVWVRVAKDPALLVLSRDDVRRVLGGSPDPFASDPPSKKKGMTAFQPDAATISRDGAWENRRRFNEAVLDTGRPHRFAERFQAMAREEADALLDAVDRGGGELDFDEWQHAFRRITRRVVFGDHAADDERLTELLGELMDEGNGMPGEPSEKLPGLMERIHNYVDIGEEGTLVSLFGEAPHDEATKPEGQVPHWLFASHDTLAINSFRCLALLASHSHPRRRVEEELAGSSGGGAPYLDACLHEAMRLWPTTPMLARETVSDVDWNGATVPAGTQVVIVNTFLHRDPSHHEFANRFEPEAWTDGTASDDWAFNHLSHGPQGCPGSGLALMLGRAVIGEVLTKRTVRLLAPDLDPGSALPHTLNFFAIRLRLQAD